MTRARHFDPRSFDEVGDLLDRSRTREQVSLQVGAVQLAEHRELLVGLDAFGDDAQAEVLGERETAATIAVSSRSVPIARTNDLSILRMLIGKARR